MKIYSPLKVWFVVCQEMLLESEEVFFSFFSYFSFLFLGVKIKTNKQKGQWGADECWEIYKVMAV